MDAKRRGDGFNTQSSDVRDQAVYTARALDRVLNNDNIMDTIGGFLDSTSKVKLGTTNKSLRHVAKKEYERKIRESNKIESLAAARGKINEGPTRHQRESRESLAMTIVRPRTIEQGGRGPANSEYLYWGDDGFAGGFADDMLHSSELF